MVDAKGKLSVARQCARCRAEPVVAVLRAGAWDSSSGGPVESSKPVQHGAPSQIVSGIPPTVADTCATSDPAAVASTEPPNISPAANGAAPPSNAEPSAAAISALFAVMPTSTANGAPAASSTRIVAGPAASVRRSSTRSANGAPRLPARNAERSDPTPVNRPSDSANICRRPRSGALAKRASRARYDGGPPSRVLKLP